MAPLRHNCRSPRRVVSFLVGAGLVAGVASRAHADPSCAVEDALSRAAAEVLLAGGERDGSAIQAAVARVGSDLVAPRALFLPEATPPAAASGSQEAPTRWLGRLAARADAPLACGRAQSARGLLLIAGPRAARLDPIGSERRVSGWLAPGFERPELVILEADGRLSRRAVTRAALSAGVPLEPQLRLPARVQLVATGQLGPRPVAERTLRAGGSADGDAPTVPVPRAVRARDPQAPVAGMLNRLRRARGVQVVRRHRLLRRLAAEHARGVCQAGQVGHALTPGADPQARLEAAGLRAQRVGETVARAEGPAAAFAALTRSPSHLLTLVAPGFTDGGVGVARNRSGQACVVVLLARWPRYRGR